MIGVLLISVVLAGCSSQKTTTTQEVTINLMAKNMAFDKSTITVPPGAHVKVIFNNQDNAEPHNFAVYETSDAKNSIFVGAIIAGMTSTTYEFNAPTKVGTYFFRCDVHPLMNGQFIVQTGATGSASGSGSGY
ncbi:MAG TPA: cupredoxin domain-containing protein [Methanofastidiosum sp.]|nr:cupredoxin domain-containing protein [Methanofastidiosum sp.]